MKEKVQNMNLNSAPLSISVWSRKQDPLCSLTLCWFGIQCFGTISCHKSFQQQGIPITVFAHQRVHNGKKDKRKLNLKFQYFTGVLLVYIIFPKMEECCQHKRNSHLKAKDVAIATVCAASDLLKCTPGKCDGFIPEENFILYRDGLHIS